MRFYLFVLYFTISIGINAQYDNFRIQSQRFYGDTIILDSLSIIPGSLIVKDSLGKLIPILDYKVNYPKASIYFKNHSSIGHKYILAYRVFPYLFEQEFYNINLNEFKSKPNLFIPKPYAYQLSRSWKNNSKIKYDGSIARELSFGNSQNVVLNARMNLQISGDITDDIKIRASITDENIPFQPEGNTADINEFDRIFIELEGKNMLTRAGDLEMRLSEPNYMKYFRRTKGVEYIYRSSLNDKSNINAKASFSIAKGKYNIQRFNGEEGNQGPYKLYGKNGETFIIIMAGTDRVFIDGIMLKRGEQNDYTIDYNSGEITFTTNRIITKDLRISIEFEYAEQNYLRSLKTAGFNINRERWNMNVNVFSESDHKNQTIQQELTPFDKQLLSSVGDSIDEAYSFKFDSLEFESGKIRYALKDTQTNGIYFDSIFIYSTDANKAFYELSFIYVGENKGSYVLSEAPINGRIYEWVSPIDGIKQGNYEPVKKLIAPKAYNLIDIESEWKLKKNASVKLNLAFSEEDINTFSDMNSQNDHGMAGQILFNKKTKLTKDTSKTKVWSFTKRLSSEWVSPYFRALERFRSVEFDRDWNTTGLSENKSQFLNTVFFGLERGAGFNASYKLHHYNRQDEFTGSRHHFFNKINHNGLNLIFKTSYLDAKNKDQFNSFFRPYLNIEKTFNKLKGISTGMIFQQEESIWNNENLDSVLAPSFKFNEYRFYLNTPDTLSGNWKLEYFFREDIRPFEGQMIFSSKSQNIGIRNKLWANKKNRLNWFIYYRDLYVADTTLENQNEDKNLNGRVEYHLNLLKGALTGTLFYELGKGMEQKKEYSYVEVPAGEGIYTWIDDGDEIQELDEFEIAAFQDQANFIKVFSVTNEYQSTYNLSFNESFLLNFKRLWYKKKGFLKFLSRFSDQFITQIDRKLLEGNSVNYFNPYLNTRGLDELVSLKSMLRNVLYFNRSHSVFGIEWHHLLNSNRIFLINGFEERGLSEDLIKIRLNWNRSWQSRLNLTKGENRNASDWMTIKNYQIERYELEKSLQWMSGRKSRLSLKYRYATKLNILNNSNEKAIFNDIKLLWQYNLVNKSALTSSISYVNINYDGSSNSSLNYIMLEALQAGKNAVWQLSWNKNIDKNIQIRFSYDGRWAEDSKAVHVGRGQVRYLF